MKETTKDLVFTDINQEEALKKMIEQRNQILNDFAKAYLAEQQVLPSEVELVYQQITDGDKIEIVCFFRRKVVDIK